MHPPDRTYWNQTVRLADLTVITDLVEDVTFENCIIEGPAVIVMLGGSRTINSGFDAPGWESFAWVVPDDRRDVVGAIGLVNCTIGGCTLRRIGLDIPESQVELARRGFVN